jgi:uncharacterized repeat protein (TIGR03833 family)
MSRLEYTSDGGYQYRQMDTGRVVRVRTQPVMVAVGGQVIRPKVGDRVKVIIKPYIVGQHIYGIVKRVLTKKKTHTRGHKVMLMDGTIGRVLEVFT